MSVLGRRRARAARNNRSRWLAVALAATSVLGGCDDPFEPFQNTHAPFSMFGYLDLQADHQWIRVTPLRQGLLLTDPAPLDAVVTLESLGSGRPVTLRDSVFQFPDARVGGVAYAHNFWTTERLVRGATYRLTATRSDGAATSALVEMPADAEVSLSYYEGPPDVGMGPPDPFRNVLRIFVRGEYLLYHDAIHMIQDLVQIPPRDSLVVRQFPNRSENGVHEFSLPRDISLTGQIVDLQRMEARIAIGPSDWPFQPGLSAAEAALPGKSPYNVENGFGFVGGLAMWSIPFSRCNPVQARPDGRPVCGHVINASSGSVVGRVVGLCAQPIPLATVQLTEVFPGGGTAVFSLRSDLGGTYAFQGLEPGADLRLEVGSNPVVLVPALAPGQRFVARDVSQPIPCSGGATELPPK